MKYKTKYRAFYREPSIYRKFQMIIEDHEKMYGRLPKSIYVDAKILNQYLIRFPAFSDLFYKGKSITGHPITYRGIEIIKI